MKLCGKILKHGGFCMMSAVRAAKHVQLSLKMTFDGGRCEEYAVEKCSNN